MHRWCAVSTDSSHTESLGRKRNLSILLMDLFIYLWLSNFSTSPVQPPSKRLYISPWADGSTIKALFQLELSALALGKVTPSRSQILHVLQIVVSKGTFHIFCFLWLEWNCVSLMLTVRWMWKINHPGWGMLQPSWFLFPTNSLKICVDGSQVILQKSIPTSGVM